MVTTPVATPTTTPEVLTVAMAVLLLLHVPPEGVATKVAVVPMQSVVLPLITGVIFTVIDLIAVQPPEE